MHIGKKKQTVDLFNKGAFKLDTLDLGYIRAIDTNVITIFFSDIHSNDILQWRV